MKNFKIIILLLIVLLAGTAAYAGSAEGYIEEISIQDHDSEYDIHVKIKWTGSGDKSVSTEFLEIRHGDFGHKGVDRVLTLLLTAFSMHKTLWFDYSGSNITRVFLKYTPN